VYQSRKAFMEAKFIETAALGALFALKVIGGVAVLVWFVQRTLTADDDAPCFGWRYCLRRKRLAADALRRFSAQVQSVRSKKTLLDEYTPEYYNTLKDSGFDELHSSLDSLAAVEESLRTDLAAKRYSRVMLLTGYLSGELHGEYLSRAQSKFIVWQPLEHWKRRIDSILISLSDSLNIAAAESERLGIKRARARKPTLLVAAELRKEISSNWD
jgi:hypothetical protein